MSCRQTSIGRVITYDTYVIWIHYIWSNGKGGKPVLFSVGWVIAQDPDKRMLSV